MNEREAWLQQRRNGIGASECAAALGINPYKSPYQLWSEKTGLAEPDSMHGNEAAEFGLRLERPIAEAYAERTGRVVSMWPQHVVQRHHVHDWLLCTPDAIQYKPDSEAKGLLQIKTTSAYNAAEWSEGPPLFYQVQCQHEYAVTGLTWGTLAVLIGGQRLRWFDLDRNDRFIDALIPKLEEFWKLCQSIYTPPPVDGTWSTAKVLAKLHPLDNGEAVELPEEAVKWAEQLECAKARIRIAEEEKQLADNLLRAAIGDNTIGVLPNGDRYSLKTQTRKGYTVEETTFRCLRKVK